jgi:hypothetical protein
MGGMTMDETELLYSGIAVGGPLDGRVIEGRFPKGVVFVSKPTDRAWIYDLLLEDGRFYARPVGFDAAWDEMSTEQRLEVFRNTVLSGVDPARELDSQKIWAAAEGGSYEVRALPDEEVTV